MRVLILLNVAQQQKESTVNPIFSPSLPPCTLVIVCCVVSFRDKVSKSVCYSICFFCFVNVFCFVIIYIYILVYSWWIVLFLVVLMYILCILLSLRLQFLSQIISQPLSTIVFTATAIITIITATQSVVQYSIRQSQLSQHNTSPSAIEMEHLVPEYYTFTYTYTKHMGVEEPCLYNNNYIAAIDDGDDVAQWDPAPPVWSTQRRSVCWWCSFLLVLPLVSRDDAFTTYTRIHTHHHIDLKSASIWAKPFLLHSLTLPQHFLSLSHFCAHSPIIWWCGIALCVCMCALCLWHRCINKPKQTGYIIYYPNSICHQRVISVF